MKKIVLLFTVMLVSSHSFAYKQGTQMFGPNGQPGLLEPIPNPSLAKKRWCVDKDGNFLQHGPCGPKALREGGQTKSSQ